MRTGHVTGLLLLASESLVVVLTIVRRRARARRPVRRRGGVDDRARSPGRSLLRASDGDAAGARPS